MATELKAFEYVGSNRVMEFTQLAAASTGTDYINMLTEDGKAIYVSALFQVTVASISTSVDFIIQGSLDKVNWFNIDQDEGTENWTTDSTYAVRYEGTGEIIYLRPYFHTETGGTAATIDIKAKIFGKPVLSNVLI